MAEVPRSSGQFCGSGPELQASHAASSAALPSVLYSSVGLSVEADSFDSGNQGSVCSLGICGSSSGREPPPPPPSFPSTDLSTLSEEESLAHINSLELRAVFLALKSLEVHVRGQSLLVRSDNTSVVSYINYQGGTHSLSTMPSDDRAVGVV